MQEFSHQLDLGLPIAARSLSTGASLWILGASAEDARLMHTHLSATGRDLRTAFFVRERNGSPPFDDRSVLGLQCDGRLRLFAPPALASSSLPHLLRETILKSVSLKESQFEDLLFVRLWGNGLPTTRGPGADGMLGASLSRLQITDIRRYPRVYEEITRRLLDRLENEASAGLRAVLQRARAVARMFQEHDQIEDLRTVANALRNAAEQFELAGMFGHAQRCESDAEYLDATIRAKVGVEPYLPMLGFAPEPGLLDLLHATAFRTYRCLGIRVPLATAVADGVMRSDDRRNMHPNFIEAGSVSIGELKLSQMLSATEYTGLVPRVRTLLAKSQSKTHRLRVWLDEEHKALLNLPVGRKAPLSDQNFQVSVHAGGRYLMPSFRTARQGRPADFEFSQKRLPNSVTVLVSSGGHKSSFEVQIEPGS